MLFKREKDWLDRVGRLEVLTLAALFCLALAVIFYKFATVPHGMTWDEAAIGYNGYAVITTRRDQWIDFLPISFQSFGDYKAPFGIYLNGLFTTVLGLELWVVRLPFALAALWSLLGIGCLTYLLQEGKTHQEKFRWALVAASVMLTTPWFVHFSRAAFESGMATSWLIWAVICWQVSMTPAGRQLPALWRKVALLGIPVWAVASMYTYHSAKLVAPLLLAFLTFQLGKKWYQSWKSLLIIAGSSLVFLIPMIYDSFWAKGGERFTQTSIFSNVTHLGGTFLTWLGNWAAHFSPQFLLLGQTTTLRHGDGQWGVLLPTHLLILVGVGGVTLFKWWQSERRLSTRWLLALSWILIGILPATIGNEVPHSNRALMALPGFVLAIVWLLDWALDYLSSSPLNKKRLGSHGETNVILTSLIGCFVLAHSLFFTAYIHNYFTNFATQSADAFKDGYLELFEYLYSVPKLDEYVISDTYGQPYIYALFSKKMSPMGWSGGALRSHLFQDANVGDLQRPNTAVAATPLDIDLPLERANHIIYGSDGQPRFYVFLTNALR